MKKLCLFILVVILLTGCTSSEKESITMNEDGINVILENATGSRVKEIAISKGEEINISSKYSEGDFKIVVTGPDGEEKYSGNAKWDWDFVLENLDEGTYSVLFEYKKATLVLDIVS